MEEFDEIAPFEGGGEYQPGQGMPGPADPSPAEQRALSSFPAQTQRSAPTPDEPDVWDRYSRQILDDLQGIASGKVKTAAEQQALDLSKQIGTAGYSVAKSRTGVMPGSTFGQAAEQAGLVRGAGFARAAEIGRAARKMAAEEALKFQAAKSAEQRGLSLSYQSMLQQSQQAEQAATQSLFGSLLQFGGTIIMGMLV
tara:strand:+ start:21173 stop:21763 length:591 start_codon:yes stop_codon:yes gene_type:complete